MSDNAHSDRPTAPDATLEKRLRAVERAVTETDRDLTGLADAAESAERLERLEERCDRLDARIEELDAALEAVRGYVGAVRAVNRDVERRADAALAATRSGDDRDEFEPTDVAAGEPAPRSVPREPLDDEPPDPGDLRRDGADPGDTEAGSSRGRRQRVDAPLHGGTDAGPSPGVPDGQEDGSFAPADPEAPLTDLDAGGDDAGGPVGPEAGRAGSSPGDAPDPGTEFCPNGPTHHEDPDDASECNESPVDMGWEPVEPTGRDRGDAAPGAPGCSRNDGGLAATETEDQGDDEERGQTGGDGSRDPEWGGGEDPDHVSTPVTDRERATNRRDDGSRSGAGSSGPPGRENGFDWPPGEGLDVDRAQPWSAPDLPPADPEDEDRSLLERLREAL